MLENNGFWDNLPHGSGDPQAKASGTATAPSLDPGYTTSKKPTTTDPPGGRNLDIEALLAEIRKRTEGSARTPEPIPSVRPAEESAAAEPTAEPATEPDDKQIMRDMLSTMRELTEEVKQLRSQIELKPHDAAHYSSERPPGVPQSTADPEDSKPDEQTNNASEEFFSGFALDSSDKPDFEIKPNDQGEPQTETRTEQPEKNKKSNKALSVISNILFYAVIVAMVLGAFLLRSTSKGSPFMVAGYAAANVLTSSMADVYPQGSLIITRQVDAKELKIGDDITFMVSEDSSITHRIIGITENYQGTGARAFQTQGTKNPNPDKEMVAAANVVGKVVFHSKALGDFANFVKKNWPILIFVLIVIIALITFLKWNAKKSDEDDGDDEEPKDEPKEDDAHIVPHLQISGKHKGGTDCHTGVRTGSQ